MRQTIYSPKQLFAFAIPICSLFVSSNLVWAGATLQTPQSTYTGLDCGGSSITGNYVYEQPFTQGIPFNVQLFSAGNECLRVAVTSQNVDTELALISPDNQFWVNDDFNGLRPRIVALTSIRGWYTLQVTRYDGRGPGGQFTFKYGRYPLSNPNCSNPTTTLNFVEQNSTQK